MMLYWLKYLTDPTFRQSEWAWRTYHDSARACRVLCDQGSASFVLILRERIDELLIEHPVPESLAKTALTFHEALKELSEPSGIVESQLTPGSEADNVSKCHTKTLTGN